MPLTLYVPTSCPKANLVCFSVLLKLAVFYPRRGCLWELMCKLMFELIQHYALCLLGEFSHRLFKILPFFPFCSVSAFFFSFLSPILFLFFFLLIFLFQNHTFKWTIYILRREKRQSAALQYLQNECYKEIQLLQCLFPALINLADFPVTTIHHCSMEQWCALSAVPYSHVGTVLGE